jgi:hypothetical protein
MEKAEAYLIIISTNQNRFTTLEMPFNLIQLKDQTRGGDIISVEMRTRVDLS